MENLSQESLNINTSQNDFNEREELLASEGINIWSATQESLENQALNELNEFAKQTSSKLENNSNDKSKIDEKSKELINLENYIKKQEELKELQRKKKFLDDKPKVNELISNFKRKKERNDVRKVKKSKVNISDIKNDIDESNCNSSGSEYIPSENDSDYEDKSIRHNSVRKYKQCTQLKGEKFKDDSVLEDFNSRLEEYYKRLEEESAFITQGETTEIVDNVTLEGNFKIPRKYWKKLYRYQQKSIKWLWSLHQQPNGGILGDEMGLGKTVQIIAFLYALDYSRIHSPFGNYVGIGPTLIVCPATVIHQWVRHFHEWSPEFRIAVLHQSGTFQGNKSVLINEINENNGILITTYQGILKYKENLLDHQWYYIILDEGHKIRNPTAKVSRAVKEFKTPHRIMLTGSPMQNNLQELWSLFDFTNPGMLGTLNTFMEHFNNPIIQGGFANSTPMQEATALSVATALKNLISPFLLRRTKAEVQEHIELPNKSEQVLFCSLTDYQRSLYKDYLMTDQVNNILGRGSKKYSSDNYIRANMLVAITSLRKICNHPDIFIYDEDDEVPEKEHEEYSENNFGFYKKSGKMVVVSALLKIWKKQKHRVLLFSQGRAMIGVFEIFLRNQNYKYLKMDGSTSVNSRQTLIDKFNEDESYDVFLLTTKVGGLGVNLTGADRVIIYDPDWNPATDTQARERAWRIGQNKQVTIYRLLSVGTIEEKMYQRQIWKQLLSNKILLDPKTHRAFKSSDLFDLFSLQEPTEQVNPETTNIFHDSRVKIQEKVLEKISKKKKKAEISEKIVFTEDKIEKMKSLAQQLAKNIKPVEPKKTLDQQELEEERLQKQKKKQELKKLNVQELLDYNREHAKEIVKNDEGNKFDDQETNCSFSAALEVADTKSKLYHELMEGKLDVKELEKKFGKKSEEKSQKKEEKKKDKVVVDKTGKVDGEKVEGLVKTEMKTISKADQDSNCDNYVLSKLFSSKGVSGALEHDSVIKGTVRKNNLRISTQASERADKAMEAIKKSRIDNWRW